MLRIAGGIAAAAVAVSSLSLTVCAHEIDGSGVRTEITYNYDGSDHTRMMESLDRGLVAVNTENGVFVSWRMLGDECGVTDLAAAPDYVLYKNGEEIAVVENGTNYIDSQGELSDTYAVAVEGGEPCAPVSVWQNNYTEIPLDKPEPETVYYLDSSGNEASMNLEFFPADASCGDLDGDGEYELILKWTSAEKDVGSPGDPAYSGTVRFCAYELDGTKMWDEEINLGKNVYSSAHTVQFLVYDFDGDGKAEMICQTSLGSKDAKGKYVSNAADPDENPDIYNLSDSENESADYRTPGYGLIIKGEEFLTVFNGETGEAEDTIDLPTKRVSASVFGDTSGNRSNRFIADVAYLDGVNPYAVYWRGYYTQRGNSSVGRTAVCGVKFENGRLSCEYNFDTYRGQPGYVKGNEKLIGNGNHNMTVADVDDDGRDEVISGSLCLEVDEENNFVKKWCVGGGHGDALHIGDYDPTHKGLEYFTVHEGIGEFSDGTAYNYGQTVIDPATGEILFHVDGSDDTGRGLMANVGMGGYYQTATSKAGYYIAEGNGVFSSTRYNMGQNFRIFWDADLYDETLDNTNYTPEVYSWNGRGMETIFRADGCVTVNGTKANPCLQADLFGDWREELVLAAADGSSLRVYTTTELTEYKLPTLMHDPVYRSGVAAQQSAYNQPPHIGFYLSEEIFKAKPVGISINVPDKTEYNVGEELDLSGLRVAVSYNDGTDAEIDDYYIEGYNKNSAGTQTIYVAYGDFKADFEVSVHTDFVCDENGNITGYNGTAEEETIPAEIDGTEVTGISEAALEDTSIKSLYVYDNITYIGSNSFSGMTIHCYDGSAMYDYAVENALDFVVEERQKIDYSVNEDFSGDIYNGFELLQGTTIQSETIDGITYTVNARGGGGDGGTGFAAAADGENTYLSASSGRFGNNGRHAYMSINNPLVLTQQQDNVIAMRIFIPSLTTEGKQNTAYLQINDSNGTVDTISAQNLQIENDTWYDYILVYHHGGYYRFILNEDGNIVSYEELYASGAESGITDILVLAAENPSSNGGRAEVYIDDLQAYTTETAMSRVDVLVKDSYGSTVSGAAAGLCGLSSATGEDGRASFIVPCGIYELNIAADGYADSVSRVIAYDDIITKNVVMDMPYTLKTSYNDDGALTVSAELNKNSEPVDGARIYIAQYSSGRPVDTAVYDIDNTDISAYISDEADTVKVFLWDINEMPCAKSLEIIR